jgi:2-iminobutanoate/2-iminopropanoate deaminase
MKRAIKTENAPAAIGPYSQAIQNGTVLYISGQLPINVQTGLLVEGIQAQAEQVLTNLEAILQSEGMTLANLVNTTIFLADIGDFAVVNEIYGRRIPPPFPARSTVQVARLPKDALIEIEAIAYYK